MTGLRTLIICLVAWGMAAPAAQADVATGPSPSVHRFNRNPTGDDNPPPAEKPRKSAPGLCGTGAGLALAGIAAVWGVCWVGRRLRKS